MIIVFRKPAGCGLNSVLPNRALCTCDVSSVRPNDFWRCSKLELRWRWLVSCSNRLSLAARTKSTFGLLLPSLCAREIDVPAFSWIPLGWITLSNQLELDLSLSCTWQSCRLGAVGTPTMEVTDVVTVLHRIYHATQESALLLCVGRIQCFACPFCSGAPK